MGKSVRFGVFFSKKEIDLMWGKPKLAKRLTYPCIIVRDIPDNKIESLLGLRVYAKVVGYMCDGKREMLAVELESGSSDFRELVKTDSGKQYLEISRSASKGGWKIDYSRFMPIIKEKPLMLHAFVGAFVGTQIADDINEYNYIIENIDVEE